MIIKKINLSALNKENEVEINDTEESLSNISNEEIIENVKKIETQVNKKKISLKDLKKSPYLNTELKEEIKETDWETTWILENPKNFSIPLEEVKEDSINEKKIIQIWISDGDTNCSILKEEKNELFLNYKWSFAEEIKLPENPQKDVNEIIWNESNEISDKPEEIWKIENIDVNKKTNLEIYSEKETLSKQNKYKKVIISSLVTMFCFLIWWWTYFLNWKTNTKWNLQENNNTTLEQLKHTEKEVIVDPMLESKNDIVKENTETQIDNIPNSNTINQKLKNHLIEKYKSK